MLDPTLHDVRLLPSLSDRPDRYPDARPPAQRAPFAYRSARYQHLREPLSADDLDIWHAASGFNDRIPLLAVGSNAYPRQLADKFADHPDADAAGVLTVAATVRDHDTAFCPVIGRRGYVPVTLAARPGALSRTWLQWLTPRQLQIISDSEGRRYDLVGGETLAANVAIDPALPHPAAVYAWWFDSVLHDEANTPIWLDPDDPEAESRLLAAIESAPLRLQRSRPQTPTGEWRVIDRSDPDFAQHLAAPM